MPDSEQHLEAEATVLHERIAGLRSALDDLEPDVREELVAHASGEIELEAGLRYVDAGDDAGMRGVLARFGTVAEHAARLRRRLEPPAPATPAPATPPAEQALVACRVCTREVSSQAPFCPHCGAPFPARTRYSGMGYEYRSATTIRGWPLVHVAFGKDANGKMRVARGVIAIGQFGVGWFTVAQVGIGFVAGIGQFMLAPLAIGQFALGLAALGQFGIGLLFGAGMLKTGLLATGVQGILDWFRGN